HDRAGAVEVGDARRVRDRLAARGGDLTGDLGGELGLAAAALLGAAEVVDDDPRAARGQQQRVRAPDRTARAGDDRDAPVEPQLTHSHAPVARNLAAAYHRDI